MQTNERFWEKQYAIYLQQPYDRKIRYESWQPGRWAANRSAIRNLLPFLFGVQSICEVGAGSAAFTMEFWKQCKCSARAVDLCPVAARYAIQIAQDMGIELEYTVGDLFTYSQKSDLVLSLGVIEHYALAEQLCFLRHCRELSNRYVLVAIPNQNSVIFRSYAAWSRCHGESYEEKHQPLSTEELAQLMEQVGLHIVHMDGFQMFLSEAAFWNETPVWNIPFYASLQIQYQRTQDPWATFPHMNFQFQDIPRMVELESALLPAERLQYGFMSYVLAEV